MKLTGAEIGDSIFLACAKKNELERYPFKTILGMAYFEFFYAGQLEKTRMEVQKFITNRKTKPISTILIPALEQDDKY